MVGDEVLNPDADMASVTSITPPSPWGSPGSSAAVPELGNDLAAGRDVDTDNALDEDPTVHDDAEASPRKRSWRRIVTIAVIVVLAATSGGLGWLAYENADRAADWQTVALDTQETLETTQASLADAEAEVERLEDRVADLAAEKAQVATEREYFQTRQELFAGLALMGNEAVSSMAGCVDAQRDVTLAAFDLDPYSYFFDSYLSRFVDAADTARAVCDGAIDDAGSFRGLLDQLLADL